MITDAIPRKRDICQYNKLFIIIIKKIIIGDIPLPGASLKIRRFPKRIKTASSHLDREHFCAYSKENQGQGEHMRSINKTMIEHAVKIAHEIKANALMVCVDVINDTSLIMEEIKKDIGFILVYREDEEISDEMKNNAQILYIPNVVSPTDL
jgi:hypothetical protein